MKRLKKAGKTHRRALLLVPALVLGCSNARNRVAEGRAHEGTALDAGGTATDVGSDAVTVDAGEAAPSMDRDRDGGETSGNLLPPIGGEPGLRFDGMPEYSDYVRLTHQQWENSVVANLRLGAPTGEVDSFIPDLYARYSNNEDVLFVSLSLARGYQSAAAKIAQRVVTNSDALSRVADTREPAAFIAEVGRRFYRRPLTDAEIETYTKLYETGAALAESADNEFEAGVQLLLEVWMQAPSFLYRVEHSPKVLNGYEIATRLALLLTDTTPSDALLDAAEAGELDSAQGVANAAKQLLRSTEATLVFRRFHDETYELGRLASIEPSATQQVASVSGVKLRHAAHLFFDRQFEDGLGLRAILLSRVGFVDAELAPFYDLSVPDESDFRAEVLPETRRGVFAQLPLLVTNSNRVAPNAFFRGFRLANQVLCLHVPPEPPSPPPPEPPSTMTNREYLSRQVSGGGCESCHRLVDPFGFAFENFDGNGRERSHDNGFEVDTTGVYPFSPDRPFADSTELVTILADSPLAHSCYAKQLTEFSLGRALSTADAALVEHLAALSLNSDESIAGLVTELVSSETFRSSGVPQ